MARSTLWLSLLTTGCLAMSGCSLLPLATVAPEETAAEDDGATQETTPAAEPVADTEPNTAPQEQPTPTAQTNHFGEAVTRAQSAVAIGQSAQSPDDWNLAASRWEQAVIYMQQVPNSDPNYAIAQQKVQEYQQNLALAERRASGEMPNNTPTMANVDRPPGLVASIPIVGQMGGTRIVPVTLTGNGGTQQFNMLFDTGASLTLITPEMADAVGALVIGSIPVTVADGRQVQIPLGYIDTLKVGDLVVRDLRVGIGGDVALLGQDVYGEYGLSIGGSRIDLYR